MESNPGYLIKSFCFITVKLGFKERLKSEQIGISEQFCDDQKVFQEFE